jgi:putative phosphoesterase
MIVGFLSDAHGNDVGLDRCLAALDRLRVEQVYFLGDSLGYMPREEAVLRQLENASAVCVRGNHEEMILGNLPYSPAQEEAYHLHEARDRLPAERVHEIEEWPLQREVIVDGVRLLLVHGSPEKPTTGYLYPDTELASLAGLPYDFVFCGHTHRPFVRASGPVVCCNVGSCGMPRDVGDLASFAILDTTMGSIEILRVVFDAKAVLSAFADRVHHSVTACLQRTAPTFEGRLIDV